MNALLIKYYEYNIMDMNIRHLRRLDFLNKAFLVEYPMWLMPLPASVSIGPQVN